MYHHTRQVIHLYSRRLMLFRNQVQHVINFGITCRNNSSILSGNYPSSHAAEFLKVRQQSYEVGNSVPKYRLWKQTGGILTNLKAIRFTTQSDPAEIIAFINSQDDLQRFSQQIQDLLQLKESRSYWGPHSKEKLETLCRFFLEKNCDCRNIYSFFKDNPNVLRTDEKTLAHNVQYLCDLGFKSNSLLLILNKRPLIWKLPNAGLLERVQFLWNLGLTDGQLKMAVTTFPDILTIKKKKFQQILELLRKLQFTSKQICQVIADTPQVLEESEYQTELRLQYVLFAMGITDYKEILKAKIFKYSYEHIRLRHLLLERLGLYQVPDKHGKTKIRNPSLCRIIDSTDKRFASSCANVSLEQLKTFSEMLKEEKLEEDDDNLTDEEDGDVDSDDFHEEKDSK